MAVHSETVGGKEEGLASAPSARRVRPRVWQLRRRLWGNARRKRRTLLRARGFAVLALPTLFFGLSDLARRATQLFGFPTRFAQAYWATVLGSLVFWALWLHAAGRAQGWFRWVAGGVFFVLFMMSFAVEGAAHSDLGVYLTGKSFVFSESVWGSLSGDLPLAEPWVLLHVALATLLASACLWAARRWVRPRRIARLIVPWLTPLALAGALVVPVSESETQATLPDLLYFRGASALLQERAGITQREQRAVPQRRTPKPLGALTASPARPRNVLFILQEAQRADVSCVDPKRKCKGATPFSHTQTPRRFPLLQLRANTGSTASSMHNLLTGVSPIGSREALLSAPTLWEYAAAAGYDTAYVTSQNLMFANFRLLVQDAKIHHKVLGTNIDPHAHLYMGVYDERATDELIDIWGELQEPFFAVIQYSNIHTPRRFDKQHAPFYPSDDRAPNNKKSFQNYYKNVVYRSDKAVGSLLRHVRGTESGKRTVVVYTADHGESFYTNINHCQHSCAVFDDHMKVPGWVDAPEGTLTQAEKDNLKGFRKRPTFHSDLAATMLDLLGLWGHESLRSLQDEFIGVPLTRRGQRRPPQPLTNVTWIWEFEQANWGLMDGFFKVMALQNDRHFRCYNLAKDKREKKDLLERKHPPEPCMDLKEQAELTFGGTPRGRQRLQVGGGFPAVMKEPDGEARRWEGSGRR